MSTKKTTASPAVETNVYTDGTTATGTAPLPDQSPAQQVTAAAPTSITPTVGRRVHFWPNEDRQAQFGVFDAQQPCDAGVLYVWGDRCVNLDVTGPSGVRHTVQSVRLLQGDEKPEDGESYAAWMPYQTKQAAAAS